MWTMNIDRLLFTKIIFIASILAAFSICLYNSFLQSEPPYPYYRYSTYRDAWPGKFFSNHKHPIFVSPKIINNATQLHEALSKGNLTQKYNIVIWNVPPEARSTFNLNSSECGLCNVSYDRNKVTDASTKAIVYHFHDLNLENMPQDRRTDQYYVWWSMESPLALREMREITLAQFDGVFNLTMTYRRDADIYSPYNTMSSVSRNMRATGSGNPSEDVDLLMKRKTHLAVWIASNCGFTSGAAWRLKVVDDLVKAGLPVDKRGKCFPQNEAVPPGQQTVIIHKYKFYFAFENAIHCRDYITEKLFDNSFMTETVPVVFGATKSDYEAIVPPHSCIYVEDYETPVKLTKYLLYLHQNDTAYKEYFAWRFAKPGEMFNVERKVGFCALCQFLHSTSVDSSYYYPSFSKNNSSVTLFDATSRIVPSLRQWFYGLENRDCLATYR